ncbi:MAG: DNA translocase FtsK [Streptococcaceae bacterium]|jgi:S-DNA-T family DNA segregation ATPase FtsK/SpoIIIE|nr:DNA translocase FtsK [Streptococcaceae bacterium]
MVKQKKRRTRRKTKKELVRKAKIRRQIILIINIFLLLAGIFKVGFVGILINNLLRFFVGESAFVLGVSLILISALALFKRTSLLKKHLRACQGLLLIYLSVLLLLHTSVFSSILNKYPNALSATLTFWWHDFSSFQIAHRLGGGIIGAGLFFAIHFLFANIGCYVAIFLGILIGLFLALPITIADISEWFEQRAARPKKVKREKIPPLEVATPTVNDESSEIVEYPAPVEDNPTVEIDEETGEIQFPEFLADADDIDYELPSVSLLKNLPKQNQTGEASRAKGREQVLLDTFAAFHIDGIKIVDTKIGPSLTQYELKLPPGMRVNRFENLAKDLALALGTNDVRIEAPIPGKSLVGLEIPNQTMMTVSFREVAEATLFSPNLLEVPLGRDIEGNVRSFDLTRMPHLLIAGSTGSGKSVAINGIITSILMKARPNQVKFMMVDPKMVELSVYNDIPHLLTPVVTNPKKAARALQKVVEEMERRYELFSQLCVRNLNGYHEKKLELQGQDEILETLPLIVVIVDELADLMMVASKEVEDAIIRLGQKARAAGIHMILATQRPSTDVISGLIKANVPSRMAFAVSSGIDSRTILDMNGAEKLLGRGDMLFKPIDKNHPVRIQGAFLSDAEVENIVNFIKAQSSSDYVAHFEPEEIEEAAPEESSGQDELFETAKALVIEAQKASASMLQRRLGTGFNRATRLMDDLEEAGIIGSAVGTKPREVLVAKPEEEY